MSTTHVSCFAESESAKFSSRNHIYSRSNLLLLYKYEINNSRMNCFLYCRTFKMHHNIKYYCSIWTQVCCLIAVVISFLPDLTLELNEDGNSQVNSRIVNDETARTFTINTQHVRFRPFITCWNCTSFAECFRRCPFKEYPGLDQ